MPPISIPIGKGEGGNQPNPIIRFASRLDLLKAFPDRRWETVVVGNVIGPSGPSTAEEGVRGFCVISTPKRRTSRFGFKWRKGTAASSIRSDEPSGKFRGRKKEGGVAICHAARNPESTEPTAFLLLEAGEFPLSSAFLPAANLPLLPFALLQFLHGHRIE
jgi:hypothetical protein